MQVNVRIYGQVQGVFFRRSAKEEADKLSLVGWARNNSDGSVEVVAVGSKEKLDKFIKWCKEGSQLANVEKVDVSWRDSEGEFENFEIV